MSNTSTPNRINISSGSEWEPKIGYSRAVRIGNQIAVSGTTAPGETLTDQTRAALETIKAALAEAGATLGDVIRTRMYLRDMTQWEQAALAHGEVFGEIRPATTILEVSSLIDPALLIEIEADAVIS
ncbi:RidA family protein [Rhodococcus erythropolis]|jgi:enamine deaminase RidA (YjgF/YER057c/UK114 family)|uniref:RidA family protein n=1 Tax=Rhodococcus baikonurensis TaxID=172041 RepID=A0ABV5XNF5_9NOCA|nr:MULTISPECIES: RidA family protein [Rhodococcus]NHP14237.1 RidA family protein [Rhodococcus sp. IC4_135]MBJ7480232.1 RidA family protein [Rhodococcus sp. (in: high G+C Gram-positive bacteria)]MDI9956536.1 RidA family protein [Rhodococcus sp. IEGM 1237]MDI9964054.1 RidA family protein [Rhodococcus sp. IEGM 1251]MDV8124409.1 RidA family protein [Rhodococcus sp. IEGM 1304]